MAWTKEQSGSAGPELVVTLSEEAPDASSKTLLFSDVGVGAQMEILAIRIEFVATVTVGTRTMEVRIEQVTGPDILYQVILVLPTLTASQSRNWQLAPGIDEAVTAPQYVQMPSGLHIHEGQQLVIEDTAAIDAAADDMVIHVLGRVVSR